MGVINKEKNIRFDLLKLEEIVRFYRWQEGSAWTPLAKRSLQTMLPPSDNANLTPQHAMEAKLLWSAGLDQLGEEQLGGKQHIFNKPNFGILYQLYISTVSTLEKWQIDR